jgi:hypothetical protein
MDLLEISKVYPWILLLSFSVMLITILVIFALYLLKQLLFRDVFFSKQAYASDTVRSIKHNRNDVGLIQTEGAGITFLQDKIRWMNRVILWYYRLKTKNKSEIGIFSAHKRLHRHGWIN